MPTPTTAEHKSSISTRPDPAPALAGQDLSDRHEERPGVTVRGFGPKVNCAQCCRNSLIVGVWFWGVDASGISVQLLADVDRWKCPLCFDVPVAPVRARRSRYVPRHDQADDDSRNHIEYAREREGGARG